MCQMWELTEGKGGSVNSLHFPLEGVDMPYIMLLRTAEGVLQSVLRCCQ